MNGSGDREGKRGGAAPGVRRRSATASAASAGGAGDGRSSGVGGGGGGGGSGGSGADSTGEQACKKVTRGSRLQTTIKLRFELFS